MNSTNSTNCHPCGSTCHHYICILYIYVCVYILYILYILYIYIHTICHNGWCGHHIIILPSIMMLRSNSGGRLRWDIASIASTVRRMGKGRRVVFFFPTCQVRVVRFYVSCLLLSSPPHRTVVSVGPQPRPSTPSVPCRTSTTTIRASVPCRTSTAGIHAKCSLPDLM